ncbi:MAG TPA: sensor histidine kinase [Dehalococcoidia bacterium]|nr:sensor histidine kinase [Dehalococcoidia bacterium]
MKSSANAKRILFVAAKRRETGSLASQLRSAGHLVSLVEDLEAARGLLASQGFDQAVFPASLLSSILERQAVWEAADTEAWRSATAGVVHDLHGLLDALNRSLDEPTSAGQAQFEGGFDSSRLADLRRRVAILSLFLQELVMELTNDIGRELNLTVLDLEDAVEAAAVAVYPTAAERRQRLVIDIDQDVSRLQADRPKLKRVLTNLLNFAVTHNPVLGTVAVRACRDNDHCIITVSDEGEAVTQSELRRLFSPASGPGDASGLGLSQVKRIVELHGGRVWVESEKGSGTTVFISLPLPSWLRRKRSRLRISARD